jgi:hypothetical protein
VSRGVRSADQPPRPAARPTAYVILAAGSRSEAASLAEARELAASIVASSPSWLSHTRQPWDAWDPYEAAVTAAEYAPEHGATIDLPDGQVVIVRPLDHEDRAEKSGACELHGQTGAD